VALSLGETYISLYQMVTNGCGAGGIIFHGEVLGASAVISFLTPFPPGPCDNYTLRPGYLARYERATRQHYNRKGGVRYKNPRGGKRREILPKQRVHDYQNVLRHKYIYWTEAVGASQLFIQTKLRSQYHNLPQFLKELIRKKVKILA